MLQRAGAACAALLAVIFSAATLTFAAPATASPCDGGMANIEYGLDYALGELVPLPAMTPGAACSPGDSCGDGQRCEGGSCCVEEGGTCSGLGYCCGHPSQGCVDGHCPKKPY